jgi:hypothetical protein
MLQNICNQHQVISFHPPAGDDTNDGIDASNFLSKEAIARTSEMTSPVYIRPEQHLGTAGGQYWAFRLVGYVAGPNDIVMVLNGDDELSSPNSLQVINDKYVDDGVWFSYGSYQGEYSEQTKPIPDEMTVIETDNMTRVPFNPRKDEPTWRFGHPRTFKAHLTTRMTRKDFTYKDGSWLLKSTDRGFVYRMLELSGVDRVGYIADVIYKYNCSKALSTIDENTGDAHLQHVKDLEPSSILHLPIHVVLVCWGRIYTLGHQLQWLQEQTGLKGRSITLHLLNNNADERKTVDNIAAKFLKWEISANLGPGTLPLQVSIVHNTENWHAFSRFLYVDVLRRQAPIDSVIFLDDDQHWLPTFVSSLIDGHKPKGMTTWYGKNFEKDSNTGFVTFWRSTVTWTDILYFDAPKVTSFTYDGPGGSIFDTNLWLFGHQLLRLKHEMKEYFSFDDVWVSYVLDALLGWEQRRLLNSVPIDILKANHQTYGHIFEEMPERREGLLALHKL